MLFAVTLHWTSQSTCEADYHPTNGNRIERGRFRLCSLFGMRIQPEESCCVCFHFRSACVCVCVAVMRRATWRWCSWTLRWRTSPACRWPEGSTGTSTTKARARLRTPRRWWRSWPWSSGTSRPSSPWRWWVGGGRVSGRGQGGGWVGQIYADLLISDQSFPLTFFFVPGPLKRIMDYLWAVRMRNDTFLLAVALLWH